MLDDLPPDLHRLETLRMWHALWLDRIDAKIARLRAEGEQQACAVQQRVERAPEWLLERGIGHGGRPVEVHCGDCHAAGKRRQGISAEEARRALADGVPACTHCRPDTELGVLEG
ncbi:DUF6233 domain-containing protein [Streptomyces alfalfae]